MNRNIEVQDLTDSAEEITLQGGISGEREFCLCGAVLSAVTHSCVRGQFCPFTTNQREPNKP